MDFPATSNLYTRAFENIYNDDRRDYGEPDHSTQGLTAMKDVEKWLQTINTHVGPVTVATVETEQS